MRRYVLGKNLHIRTRYVIFTVFVLMALLTYTLWAEKPFVMPPDKPEEQITAELDVWAWNIAAASLREVLPQFNERFPNVKINVHTTMANVQSRFLLSLSSGVGAPDITQLLVAETPRYTSTKRMLDLTAVAAKYEKDFIPSFWKSCLYKGHVYAIPWGSGPCAVFYKRRLFDRYGIDPNIETWDDYIKAGKVILEKSKGKTKMFHLPTSGAPNGLAYMFEILIQQNGGQIFNNDGQIDINWPCLQAIKLLKKMLESGITSSEMLFSHAHYASLKNDTIATYPIAAWWGGTIKDYAPETAGDWGVFRLPALEPGGLRTSNLGGSVLVIPDQCEQKEAAWAFVEFVLCRPEIQNIHYRIFDLIPCLIPSFNDPLYDQPDPFYDGQKIRRLFTRDIEKIHPLNRNKDWQEAIGYVSQVFSGWAANGMNTEEKTLLCRLEEKLHRRLNREIAPTSLRYREQ